MCKCIFCSQIFSYKKGKKVKMPEIHSYMAIKDISFSQHMGTRTFTLNGGQYDGWAYARMTNSFILLFFALQLEPY